MHRETTTRGLTTLLLAAAVTTAAQAQPLRLEIIHLPGVTLDPAFARSGDGVALAAGRVLGTTRADLPSVRVLGGVMPSDDPRQGAFMAGSQGVFYRTSATSLSGIPVEVFHNSGDEVAVTVPPGRVGWFAGQVRATQLAQNAGLGPGGREMARAFAHRLHGTRGQEVEDQAVTRFVDGLASQGATGVAADDPRVAAFLSRVLEMKTSTGMLAVRSDAQAKELGDRALGLVPWGESSAARGSTSGVTILGS